MRAPPSDRRRRGRLRLAARIGASACAAAAVALVAVGAVAYVTTPSVRTAPAIVRAALRGAGERPLALPLPARVAEATVAVEDRRFYDHGALDVRSLARVAWWTVTGRAQDPGGATITLQLARVLFGRGQVRDLALAFKLQDRFSRERILELYLDSVYYGHAARGIQAASRTYFGTSVRRLTWAQASLLAGLPQAPSAYDPLEHLALARRRQREVLDALVATGALTRARALRVSAEPLRLRGAPGRALQHPSRRRGPAAVAADTAPPTRSKAR